MKYLKTFESIEDKKLEIEFITINKIRDEVKELLVNHQTDSNFLKFDIGQEWIDTGSNTYFLNDYTNSFGKIDIEELSHDLKEDDGNIFEYTLSLNIEINYNLPGLKEDGDKLLPEIDEVIEKMSQPMLDLKKFVKDVQKFGSIEIDLQDRNELIDNNNNNNIDRYSLSDFYFFFITFDIEEFMKNLDKGYMSINN